MMAKQIKNNISCSVWCLLVLVLEDIFEYVCYSQPPSFLFSPTDNSENLSEEADQSRTLFIKKNNNFPFVAVLLRL